MSNIKRQAIISLAAIGGAQVVSLATVQAVGRSSDCVSNYQPGDVGRWAEQQGAKLRNQVSYSPGDVNRWIEQQGANLNQELSNAPSTDATHGLASASTPVAQQPATVQPVATSQTASAATATAAPVANDGATTESVWAHEQRLPTAAEESDYQSLRHSGMRKRGHPGVPHQTRTAL